MTKPKTLEQFRADKERAETQLAQELHKLERLENRLSHAHIGVISAPMCAFYHHSLGEFSIVPVQPYPFQFHSGSKLGQAQSSRIPLTSRVESIYIERGSPGRKLFGLFSYSPKLR